MKALGGEEIYLLLILNLGTRWGEWLASRPGRTLAPGKVPRYPLCRRLGMPQSRSGHKRLEENPFTSAGIEPRSPGRPARSQTLCWLSLRQLVKLFKPSIIRGEACGNYWTIFRFLTTLFQLQRAEEVGNYNMRDFRFSRRRVWRWQSSGIFLRCHDDGDSKHLWNVGHLMRDYTAQYLRVLRFMCWYLYYGWPVLRVRYSPGMHFKTEGNQECLRSRESRFKQSV
jgi:hypothetical protein